MAIVVKKKEYIPLTSVDQTSFSKTWGRTGVKCVNDPVRVTMADGSQFIGVIKNLGSGNTVGVLTPSGAIRSGISLVDNRVELIVGGV